MIRAIFERVRAWLVDIGIAYLEWVLPHDKKFVITIDPVDNSSSVEELFK